MQLSSQTIKKIVREELPGLIKRDKSIRQFILDLTSQPFTEINEKIDELETETESRFDRLLEELKKNREEDARKWDEQNREQNKKWDEQNKEQNKKWEEQNKKWDEWNKRWEEHKIKYDEENKAHNIRWEKNQKEIEKLYITINRKHDTTLGALGARWGLRSEASFRNALKDILKDFNIKVLNIKEYDEEGEVFGRPEDVELDVVIMNGKLYLCELKSSMSRADMYAFYKKAGFYEKIHKRKADRLVVISPMVEARAIDVSKELGIKVYSYADEMGEDILKEL